MTLVNKNIEDSGSKQIIQIFGAIVKNVSNQCHCMI